MATHRETLLRLLETGRVLRYRDLATVAERPIPRMELLRLQRSGHVVQVEGQDKGEGGLGYRLAGLEPSPLQRLAAVHPDAVLCGITAQRMHGLTDALPRGSEGVVAAISRARHRTSVGGVSLVTWTDPRLFSVGVETVDVGGATLHRTDRWRTILDMYRPNRSSEPLNANVGERRKALALLVREDGGEAERKLSSYAMRLGLRKHIAGQIDGFSDLIPYLREPTKEDEPCATPTPRS